jgi:hypothetical protein
VLGLVPASWWAVDAAQHGHLGVDVIAVLARELRALLGHSSCVVHRYANGQLTNPMLDDVRPGDLLLVQPEWLLDGPTVSVAAIDP